MRQIINSRRVALLIDSRIRNYFFSISMFFFSFIVITLLIFYYYFFFVFLAQIFIGCRNGIVQIVSLANGKPFKSVQIGRRVPILGLAVNEDKFGVRLIIWHKEGIEMRSFPLEKFPPKKRSTEKNDTESKQKAPRKATKSKFFEMLSRNAL